MLNKLYIVKYYVNWRIELSLSEYASLRNQWSTFTFEYWHFKYHLCPTLAKRPAISLDVVDWIYVFTVGTGMLFRSWGTTWPNSRKVWGTWTRWRIHVRQQRMPNICSKWVIYLSCVVAILIPQRCSLMLRCCVVGTWGRKIVVSVLYRLSVQSVTTRGERDIIYG